VSNRPSNGSDVSKLVEAHKGSHMLMPLGDVASIGLRPSNCRNATHNKPVAAEVRKRLKWLGDKGSMYNDIIARFLMLEGNA